MDDVTVRAPYLAASARPGKHNKMAVDRVQKIMSQHYQNAPLNVDAAVIQEVGSPSGSKTSVEEVTAKETL